MNNVSIWSDTIATAMTSLWIKVANFVPNLFAACLILLIGYFVAKSLAFLLAHGLKRLGFDKLAASVGISDALVRANVGCTSAELVSKLGFWLIMLSFLISATEALGLVQISATIEGFVLYLPKVMAAVLVLIVGLYLAGFARDLVKNAAESTGIVYAKPLASAVYGILFVIILSLAINQMEIETDLLNSIVAILIAAFGIAIALSLGLGTRELSTHITAGVYVRDLFEVGDVIEFDDVCGSVIRVGTVKTVILCDDGSSVSIANTQLVNTVVRKKA